jgi:hypothetical protein
MPKGKKTARGSKKPATPRKRKPAAKKPSLKAQKIVINLDVYKPPPQEEEDDPSSSDDDESDQEQESSELSQSDQEEEEKPKSYIPTTLSPVY